MSEETQVLSPAEVRQIQMKAQIIDELKKVPIVQIVCEKVGLGRATFYRWKKDDQEFAAAVDEALDDGSKLVSDLAESKLISAIKSENLTAIIFWLRNHHAKYKNKVELSGNITHFREELTDEESEMLTQALTLTGFSPQDVTGDNKETDANEPREGKLPDQPDQE